MTRNVLAWLEQAARRRPEAIAFEAANSALSYGALLLLSRQIGSAVSGVIQPQSPVLIYMDKGPQAIAAMLGAVYAGCFYTPIDPGMPRARLERIVSVLSPRLVIAQRKYVDCAAAVCPQARLLCADEVPQAVDEDALARIRREMIDTDLLYVLFTSGSTGVPKGVAIRHRSVLDFVRWACGALGITEDCRFGNQAPLYFDNSILDIYCAMRMGGCVHFIPQKHFTFPATMAAYLAAHDINTLFWVPSALTAVAATGIMPEGLRNVFFCGEVMPCKTLNIWKRALPEASYVNMYGPTEITDVCAYFPVTRDFADTDALPIGFPCENTRIHLIDGEICVAGTGLSPGYYGAPESTRAAFVQNPLRTDIAETIYKTGDLGTYNEHGELMFLGRRDSQIKRSGYRIELGEIECALCAQPEVSGGCCLYDAAQEKILCFYAGALDEKQLLRRLKETVPKYMLPDVICRKAQLPETGNGKLDRVALKREWEREHPVL